MTLSETTIFVGSGLSVPMPSGLPLFRQMRKAFFAELRIPGPEDVACESVLWLLYDSGLDIDGFLNSLLKEGQFNAGHQVVAGALLAGATIWTPNADELIEAAGGPEATALRVSGLTEVHPGQSQRLIKPHGTISEPSSLAFRAPDVLAAPPYGLVNRLHEDCYGRDVVLCGYSAVDPDLGPILLDALQSARSVCWLEITQDEADKDLRNRIGPRLATSVVSTPAPVSELIKILISAGAPAPSVKLLSQLTSPLVWRDAVAPARQIITSSPGSGEFAAARLLSQAGLFEEAKPRWAAATRDTGLLARWRTSIFAVADGLYRGDSSYRWIRSSIAFVASIPGSSSLPVLRDLVSFHAGLLELEGQYQRSLIVAKRRLGRRPKPAELLHVASAARKAGELDLAVECARMAVEDTRRVQADGSLHCRSLFELSFSLRWRGHIVEASEALLEFGRVRTYGGPVWTAWWLYEVACLNTATEFAGVAMRELLPLGLDSLGALEGAANMFRSAGTLLRSGGAHRALQADSARVVVLRHLGRFDEALALAESTWAARLALPKRSIFEEDALQIERAELSRRLGENQWAEDTLIQLTLAPCPVHAVTAMLALASFQAGPSSLRWATQALITGQDCGFGFGVVRALSILAATGHLRDKEAVSEAQAFAAEIPMDSSHLAKWAARDLAFV